MIAKFASILVLCLACATAFGQSKSGPVPAPAPTKPTVTLVLQLQAAPTAEETKALGNRLVSKVASATHNIYILTLETTVEAKALVPLISAKVNARLLEPNTMGGTITVTEDSTGARINFFKADGKTIYKVISPREDWSQTMIFRDNGKLHMVFNSYTENKSREFEYFDKDGKRRLQRTYNRDGSMDVLVHNPDGTRYRQHWLPGMTRTVYAGAESWHLKSTELVTREQRVVRFNFKNGQGGSNPHEIDNVLILNTDGTVKQVLTEAEYIATGAKVTDNLKGELGLSDDLSVPRPRESVSTNLP